jgi:hypothetical protein
MFSEAEVPDRIRPEFRVNFVLVLIHDLCSIHRLDYRSEVPSPKTSIEYDQALNETVLALVGAAFSAERDRNSVSTAEWWDWVSTKLHEISDSAGSAKTRIEHDVRSGLDHAIRVQEEKLRGS